MKKLIALLLALVLVMGLVACGEKTPENPTEEPTAAPTDAPTEAPAPAGPASALELLQTVWALYTDDEKFPVFGGDGLNMVDGAPGAYTDMEGLESQLLVPADKQGDVTEIASLFHGMMLNNFTCGAFKLAEGVDAAAFADVMKEAVTNNRWMCGFPEKYMVAIVGDCVVLVFGLNDAVNPFEAKLVEAYPDTVVKYSEALA